jgi:hypothetical protein
MFSAFEWSPDYNAVAKRCRIHNYGGGIDAFFRKISYTTVAPGLTRHSPLSKQIPKQKRKNDSLDLAYTKSSIDE